MAKYRPVYTKIWKDKDFLNAGKDSKLLFLYFITNESITNSGIYEIPLKSIAMETGIPCPTVRELLVNGSIKNIEYDLENEIVFVTNSRKYCPGGNPAQVERGIITEFKQTSKTFLWNSFLDINPQYKTKLSTVGQPLTNGSLPLPLPLKKKVLINNKTLEAEQIKKEGLEILEYLNKKAGKKFQPTDKNLGFIGARQSEGYGKDRFLHAIDCKVLDWKGDPKMDEYLRPKTLFAAGNFEGYANQIKPGPKKRRGYSGDLMDQEETIKRPPPSDELRGVWEKTIEKLESIIPGEEFARLFGDAYPRSLEAGRLEVAVPNQIIRKTMIEFYRDVFESKLSETLGAPGLVDFCIENLAVAECQGVG
jgi:uncharacterized phage protein (TIGR02220 family)